MQNKWLVVALLFVSGYVCAENCSKEYCDGKGSATHCISARDHNNCWELMYPHENV